MDSSPLSLGNQIAVATIKLAQDQQRVEGQAALELLESAAVVQAASPAASNSVGTNIDVKV